MQKLLLGSTVIATMLTSNVYAQANLTQPQFHTPIKAAIVVTKSANNHLSALTAAAPQQQTRYVYLMNVPLTREQKHTFNTFKVNNFTMNAASSETGTSNLPTRVALGMNGVPVLDQGMHGTCVTFATTAALDAILYQSNYISPLCSLEIGNYLQSRSYLPSGWDGSWGPLILERYSEFGVVSIADQKTKSCGGITEYPVDSMDDTGNPMSIDDYATMSTDINYDVTWYPLVTNHERFSENQPTDLMDNVLANVKRVLASKDASTTLRLTFGTLLPINHCSAGACGKYHKSFDSWVISKAIRNDDDLDFGGHEMVITGYDDNAISTDNEGGTHKGLLIIRNSWSTEAGDNGDYYMSYDFFKQFAMEVQVVTK